MTQSPLPTHTSDSSSVSQCFNDTSSLHDENVLSALSGLQIVEQTYTDGVNDSNSNDHQHMFDSTDEEDNCEPQQPLIIPVVSDHEESNNVIETEIGKLQFKCLFLL